MEKLVTIRNLGPEQAMLAFPLVREAVGDVTPDGWQDTVIKLTGPGPGPPSGIVIAERNGFPRGLFTYQAINFLTAERQLLVRNLVVMEIVRRFDAAGALFDHMSKLARTLACHGVHIDLPPVSVWIQTHWEQLERPDMSVPFKFSD